MLDSTSYTITEPDRFITSARLVTLHGAPIQAKQNPTQRELVDGTYKPLGALFLRAYSALGTLTPISKNKKALS